MQEQDGRRVISNSFEHQGVHVMSTITRDETHNDWGTGQPVVFSHGRPLSADAFEDQKQPV
jgi:hypothetical protein